MVLGSPPPHSQRKHSQPSRQRSHTLRLRQPLRRRLDRRESLRRLPIHRPSRTNLHRPRQTTIPRRLRRRPAKSGVCANLVAYTTFTTPGDTMMALAIPAGGHISMGKKEFGGTAGSVRGLNVEYFPFDTEEMNIDIDATEKKIQKLSEEGKKPTLAM